MVRNHISPSDLQLFSDDLTLCQRVFDQIRDETEIKGTQRNDLLAANIVRFYKQRIKNEGQLLILAMTAAIT
ncbi:hypothetical protein EV561_1667 [Rhizobium sp. BK376]|nr:hypothetical protein EV561_1667 [Rhizobium sp. BK376]